MADNLMNKEHKATNDAYREGYDRIFLEKVGDNLWKVKDDNPVNYTVISAVVSVNMDGEKIVDK